jgi:hypothetical protein
MNIEDQMIDEALASPEFAAYSAIKETKRLAEILWHIMPDSSAHQRAKYALIHLQSAEYEMEAELGKAKTLAGD